MIEPNSVGEKRTLTGKVVSNKMDKTVTVLIERYVKHPIYKKIMLRSKKYHAHNEANLAKEGDVVQICEIPPLSKTKFWNVVKIVAAQK